MSKKANKTLIGIFVLGAGALLFVAILVFGSGKFFEKRPTYVLFFEGSLKGLNVGSPVAFRGIRVGEVTSIDVLLDRKRGKILIPVYIELNPNRFTVVGEAKKPKVLGERGRQKLIDRLVKEGMRAQLQMQSMVSGQLLINLAFFPDKPVRLVGAEPQYIEVPTVPTDLQEIGKTLEKVMARLQRIPFEKLMASLTGAAEGLDKMVNTPEAQKSLQTLNQTLADLQVLVKNVNAQVDPLAGSLEETSKAARVTLHQTAVSLQSTSKAAIAALDQARRTFAKTEGLAEGDSSLGYQLNLTLEELSAAAASLRTLADTLERRPDALLRGKTQLRGK
ncbi:MAG: MlaD family protein [Deltaproteobacteria bacterium]|jgi:paraquat-inducible protein B